MIHLVFHLTHFDFWIAAQAESWPCQSADVRHDGGLTGGDGGDGDGDGGDYDGGRNGDGNDDDGGGNGGDGDGGDVNGGDDDDDGGVNGGDGEGGDVDDDGGLTGQNQSQASSNPNCKKISIWS